MEEIEKLIKIVSDSKLSEVTIEEEGIKLTVRKSSCSAVTENPEPVPPFGAHPPFPMPGYGAGPVPAWGMRQEQTAIQAMPPEVQDSADIADSITDGNKVESPLVGTFYAAPAPDKEPFVKKGDTVKKGQVIGIVEAMKLMNEIECEYDGVVVDILVENGDMVEYGQPLFMIK